MNCELAVAIASAPMYVKNVLDSRSLFPYLCRSRTACLYVSEKCWQTSPACPISPLLFVWLPLSLLLTPMLRSVKSCGNQYWLTGGKQWASHVAISTLLLNAAWLVD